MDKIPYKPVYVQWVDSEETFGWNSLYDNEAITRKGCMCHTVAYLVRESKNEIVLAHSLDLKNEKFTGILAIPKVAVVKKKVIKV